MWVERNEEGGEGEGEYGGAMERATSGFQAEGRGMLSVPEPDQPNAVEGPSQSIASVSKVVNRAVTTINGGIHRLARYKGAMMHREETKSISSSKPQS